MKKISDWIKTNAFDLIINADVPMDTDDMSQMKSYVEYISGVTNLAYALIHQIKEEDADE